MIGVPPERSPFPVGRFHAFVDERLQKAEQAVYEYARRKGWPGIDATRLPEIIRNVPDAIGAYTVLVFVTNLQDAIRTPGVVYGRAMSAHAHAELPAILAELDTRGSPRPFPEDEANRATLRAIADALATPTVDTEESALEALQAVIEWSGVGAPKGGLTAWRIARLEEAFGEGGAKRFDKALERERERKKSTDT